MQKALSMIVLLCGCGGTAVSGPPKDGELADSSSADTSIGSTDTSMEADTSSDVVSTADASVDVDDSTDSGCHLTDDSILIGIAGAGQDTDCSMFTGDGGTRDRSFTAKVVSTDVSVIKVDLCGPSAGCTPMLAEVTAKAPGLDLHGIKNGSFVQVTATFRKSSECVPRLSIVSLASWAGTKNPVDDAKTYLVASASGFGSSPPFVVDGLDTGCDHDCSGSTYAWYRLRFTPIGGGTAVDVDMGETKTVSAAGQTFKVRNLRSYGAAEMCMLLGDVVAWWATGF